LVSLAAEPVAVADSAVAVAAFPALASEVCLVPPAVPVAAGVLKPNATAEAGSVAIFEKVATWVPLWPDWYSVQAAEDPESIYSHPTEENLGPC
jgi:hypothetical protein